MVVFLIWFARRIRSVAWAALFGLLLGGTLGNLTDRLIRPPGFGVGHVVDFILVPWLLPAIFNLADTAIVTSMVPVRAADAARPGHRRQQAARQARD